MPCGGICPAHPNDVKRLGDSGACCFYCGQKDPLPNHWIFEWDALIHGECVEPFLTTKEGKIILSHKHEVIVLDGETFKVIRKEGDDA